MTNNNEMRLIPIQTELLGKGAVNDLMGIIAKNKIIFEDGDILAVTSKIISYDENQLVELANVKLSKKALSFSKKYDLPPELCQLIIEEADEICGGVKKAILTIKNGILIANAGIDRSNAPRGFAILWPKNPVQPAEKIKNTIKKKYKKNIGVIISDSHCLPARRGTCGLAIAISGFEGTMDKRGATDLFGRKLSITFSNLADQLASSANALMGEVDQKIPAVIIKNAPIQLSRKSARALTKELIIPHRECLFSEYNVK